VTALMQYLGIVGIVGIMLASWLLAIRLLDRIAARSDAELQRRTQHRARTAGDVRGVEDPTGGEVS
jgi:hypothetical protein